MDYLIQFIGFYFIVFGAMFLINSSVGIYKNTRGDIDIWYIITRVAFGVGCISMGFFIMGWNTVLHSW